MGQGWEVGNSEVGEVQFQLGDGNLVDKQPTDLLGVPIGATPPSLAPATDIAAPAVDLVQLAADVAAIKVKLGM